MISSKERGISMSRSRHTEAQMIGALKQLEAGRKAEDVAREVGVEVACRTACDPGSSASIFRC